MNKWLEIDPGEIKDNPFNLIGKDWMLITAGKANSLNTMTASWGGLGVLWNAPVSFCFVRPTRYTYTFLEREKYYTLSFFAPGHRRELQLCGRKSGRNGDKIAEAGLTVRTDEAAPYFDEARTVLICRKMYTQDIDPAGFLDPTIAGHYDDDYHRMYVGEIVKVLKRPD